MFRQKSLVILKKVDPPKAPLEIPSSSLSKSNSATLPSPSASSKQNSRSFIQKILGESSSSTNAVMNIEEIIPLPEPVNKQAIQEKLEALYDSKQQLDRQIDEAAKKRKFEDLKALTHALQQLEEEINRLK